MARSSSLSPRWFFTSAISLLSVAALGCGGGDTQTTDTKIAIQDFQKKFDDAMCAHLVKCGDQPDAATCKRTQAADPDIAQAIAAVVYGTLTYEGGAAVDCVNTLRGSPCEVPGGLGKGVKDTCDKVFSSRHPNGGSCFTGLECASGKCKPPATCADSCCEGTCDDVGDAIALDATCLGMGKPCQVGTYCDNGSNKCTKLKDSNEACGQRDACLPGLACDVGGAGVCFQAAKSDSQCNPALKVNPCAEYNQYCDPAQSKCVPLPGPGQMAGPNCACSLDTACVAGGICQLLPVEGEDCGPVPCLGSLKCSATMMGKCLPSDGEPTCVAPQ